LSTEYQRALNARKQTWETKVKADQDAEQLRERFGRKFTLQEKRERLETKTRASEAFKNASAYPGRALDVALSQRWITITSFASELCWCMASIHADTDSPSKGCISMAAQFAQACEADRAAKSSPMLLGSVRRHTFSTDNGSTKPPLSSGSSSSAESLPQTDSTSTAIGSPLWSLPEYRPGQKVEIWSSSEKAWLPGEVEKVFVEAGVDVAAEQGKSFKVPAGAVKVTHARGFKYVRAEQMQTLRQV